MFSRITGRSLRIVAAAGAIAVAAAGCSSASSGGAFKPGGGSTTPAGSQGGTATLTALQTVRLAAQKATHLRSFAATFSLRVSLGPTMTIAGSMEGRLRPLGLYADIPSLRVGGHSMSMAEILTSKALYLKVPQLKRHTGGKPWAEAKLSELRSASGVNLGAMIQQVSNESPGSQARTLLSASHARVVGHDVINGVAVTEYTGTVPLSAVVAKMPPSLRTFAQQTSLGHETFKVWMDDQYQMHKMITSLANGLITTEIVMTSINQPVHLPIPPASQVYQVPASALGS